MLRLIPNNENSHSHVGDAVRNIACNFFRRKLTLALLITAMFLDTVIDAVYAEQPTAFTHKVQPVERIERVVTEPIDLQAIKLEDEQRELEGAPYRFAIPRSTLIAVDTSGTWEEIDDKTLLWRLRISSPGAESLNLGFTRYHMPSGGILFVYSADGSQVLGPFTERHNEDHGQLWTPVILSDEIVVELTIPAESVPQLDLELTSINHGYRGFEVPETEKSGACNIDVVCPAGDPWQDQIRSVAVYSIGGSLICTGVLVNNTAEDNTPYFLTANHCGVDSGNAYSMVVYWNYQRPSCGSGSGSLSQYQSGAYFRASYTSSDFTLVELDDDPDCSFNVYFAGWSRSSTAPSSAVAIHHPSCDEKSISFENNPTSITSYLGSSSPGDGTHIRVADWDLGTTEPGSSGCPLFDPSKRIVGQLHGGYAACDNDLADWFGRFYKSWTGGGTNSTRLSNWLDPLGTGQTTLDGKNNPCGGVQPLSNDTPVIFSAIPKDFSFTVNSSDWCGVAINPSTDHDIKADDNSDFSSPYASSTYGSTVRDFVVTNGHSWGSTMHYARVYYGSSSNYTIEAEWNIPDLSVGSGYSESMGSGEVIEMYEIPLTSGQTYQLNLDITSGSGDLAVFIFKPSRSSGSRSGADWSANSSGAAGDESITFTADSTGAYGIAVINENANLANYTLTINLIPSAPILASPPDGSHQTCGITFQWNSVYGATNYRIYMLAPGWTDFIYDETTSTSYDYAPPLMGEYHWKVKAYANGNWSDYSEEWIFYFDGLSAPTLISPPNGSEIADVRPTFQWNPVTCANYYELQLARDSSFTDMVRVNPTIYGTSWQLDNQDLTAGQIYYWRVCSASPLGQWSNVWHFTVVVLDTTPPNPNPMTWNTMPYAMSTSSISMTATTATDTSPPIYYQFDFVDSPTGGAGGTDSEWQTSTTYTDSVLQPNHQYRYQVHAKDSATVPNTNTFSTIKDAYTYANPPGAESFSNVTQTSIQANWTANGNPAGTQYLCENTTLGTNSGWTSNIYWNESGLECGTQYCYQVRAKNGEGVETTLISLGCQNTLSCPQVTISASAGLNGTVEPTGVFDVNLGQDVTFTAEPNAGYTVDWWYLDSNAVQEGGITYTLSDIQTNHNVLVTFIEILPMDLNNDGIVNFGDFAIFAFYWMDDTCSEPDWCEGSDSDYSGKVDFVDLLNFVDYWLWRRGDLDLDGDVDFVDYAVFANQWMNQNCDEPNWCEGADLDKSGSVDLYDLSEFTDNWLEGF